MKHTLTLSLLSILVFVSCQKETFHTSDNYLDNVKAALKDSVSSSDYIQLDFSRAVLSEVDSVQLYYLRIPLKNMKLENDFVIVKTNSEGKIEAGKIVHLKGQEVEYGEGTVKRRTFNGSISISSLDRKKILNSAITNGFIEAFHSNLNKTAKSLEPVQPSDMLPEVVVVAIIHRDSGLSFSDLACLQSFFTMDTGADNPSGGYYGSMAGNYGDYGYIEGGGGSGNSGGEINNDPPILIDQEIQDENEPINIEKFINCFNAIPDAGATCSIEILADIPVDSDPNKIFNFSTRSPGHTFLNIRKRNGSQSVSQNIGFYPKKGWKTILTNAPIDGKFVDNHEHEFNAGFKINITPAQLHSAIVEMQRDENRKYDIDNYNCTDWALDVFNAAGGNLQIPLYDIPGNYPSSGTRMPNGVYNKLREMYLPMKMTISGRSKLTSYFSGEEERFMDDSVVNNFS